MRRISRVESSASFGVTGVILVTAVTFYRANCCVSLRESHMSQSLTIAELAHALSNELTNA